MDEVMSDDNCIAEQPTEAASAYYENVRIEKAVNGFMVRVGCKKFVTRTWEELSVALGEYWENPQKAEKKYLNK